MYASQKIKTELKIMRYQPSIDSALKIRLCRIRIFLKKFVLLERLMVQTYSRVILKIKINYFEHIIRL